MNHYNFNQRPLHNPIPQYHGLYNDATIVHERPLNQFHLTQYYDRIPVAVSSTQNYPTTHNVPSMSAHHRYERPVSHFHETIYEQNAPPTTIASIRPLIVNYPHERPIMQFCPPNIYERGVTPISMIPSRTTVNALTEHLPMHQICYQPNYYDAAMQSTVNSTQPIVNTQVGSTFIPNKSENKLQRNPNRQWNNRRRFYNNHRSNGPTNSGSGVDEQQRPHEQNERNRHRNTNGKKSVASPTNSGSGVDEQQRPHEQNERNRHRNTNGKKSVANNSSKDVAKNGDYYQQKKQGQQQKRSRRRSNPNAEMKRLRNRLSKLESKMSSESKETKCDTDNESATDNDYAIGNESGTEEKSATANKSTDLTKKSASKTFDFESKSKVVSNTVC